MATALEVVSIVALVIGAFVLIAFFFFGPRE